jgi:hypothetical protein
MEEGEVEEPIVFQYPIKEIEEEVKMKNISLSMGLL